MKKNPTIKNSLLISEKKLKIAEINSARLDAEILLAQALEKNKEFIYTQPDLQLTTKQLATYNSLIKRRFKNEPIAYILGRKDFYGLGFKINKHVLVPRPETEMMVEEILSLTTNNHRPTTVIDAGTGSGCIIISIVKNLTEQFKPQDALLCHSRPLRPPRLGHFGEAGHSFSEASESGNLEDKIFPGSRIKSGMTIVKFFAIDNSKGALNIARRNARIHKVAQKIKFIKGDLLAPLIDNPKFRIANCELIIAANLPYLIPGQYKNNKGLTFEPRAALVGGKDGLKYIDRILGQVKKILTTNNNLSILVCLEIDPSQTKKLKRLVNYYLPQASLQIKKDLSGRNRLAIVKII